MNQRRQTQETMEDLRNILEERGRKALEMARKTVLEEEIECNEVYAALKYFITDYWHDVARPALLSIACEVVGGDPDATTPIAVPMTLISGAIDIHDDIIDGSKSKGSRPTVLGKFGKDIALLIGDALLFKGFTLLNETVKKGIPAEKVTVVTRIIKRTFFELGDAEALELKFRGRTDITPEEYLRVLRKKAADVEAHTRISAILGGGTKEEIDELGEYGRILGMIILLRDDLIDMIDLGEAVHRIKKEHLSLPILYALQKRQIKSRLGSFLLKKAITKKDAEKILVIVDEAGGFDRSEEIMQQLAQRACTCLERFTRPKRHLELIVKAMVLPEWRSFLKPTRT